MTEGKSTTSLIQQPRAPLKALAIEYLAIQQLKQNPANARIHSQEQVRQIARSIKDLGFNVPVLGRSNRSAHCRAWSRRGRQVS